MRPIQVMLVTLYLLSGVLNEPSCAQTAKVPEIPQLLKEAKYDHKQKIERLAALKFHKLINTYRKQNKLNGLKWDESLWLTCRNHNIWMNANTELSHREAKGSLYFTGIEPGDRYEYVTSGKGNCEWSGENALYNYERSGKTIREITDNIAEQCFEQWKNSPGHNENMLGTRHQAHGVAFYLGNGGRVYGTDLFVSYTDDKYTKKFKDALASAE